MGKKQGEEEILPLNQNLFNEFSIQELEERLETDPFLLNNLFNLNQYDVMGCSCNKIGGCPELTCGCDGGKQPCNHCPLQLCGEFKIS